MPRPRKPSSALVVAILALFIALGGTVYAATLAPPNSVNSAAIISGQVKNHNLAYGSVTGSKLARGAIMMETDHNSFSVQRGSVGSGEAACPHGTHVVSGGYVITTDTIAYPLAAYPSHRPPEGYHVLVEVPPQQVGQPTDTAHVDVIAYCAKGQLEWSRDFFH